MWQVHGLKNCDTCRKARKWLEAEGIAHQFRDLKAEGASEADIARWLDAVGTEKLINRRGTTWRGLDDSAKAQGDSREGAITLCVASTSLMKRPIFDDGTRVMVGFSKAEQEALQG